jgi:hypothetical protein
MNSAESNLVKLFKSTTNKLLVVWLTQLLGCRRSLSWVAFVKTTGLLMLGAGSLVLGY